MTEQRRKQHARRAPHRSFAPCYCSSSRRSLVQNGSARCAGIYARDVPLVMSQRTDISVDYVSTVYAHQTCNVLKVRPGSHRSCAPKNESVVEASLELPGMRRELRTLGVALAAAVVAACSSRGNLAIGNGQSSDWPEPRLRDCLYQAQHSGGQHHDDTAPSPSFAPRTMSRCRATSGARRTCTCAPQRVPKASSPTSPPASPRSVTGMEFWDVKDLDVSPDGTMLIFALRGAGRSQSGRFQAAHLAHLAVRGRQCTLTQLTRHQHRYATHCQRCRDRTILSDGRVSSSHRRARPNRAKC